MHGAAGSAQPPSCLLHPESAAAAEERLPFHPAAARSRDCCLVSVHQLGSAVVPMGLQQLQLQVPGQGDCETVVTIKA